VVLETDPKSPRESAARFVAPPFCSLQTTTNNLRRTVTTDDDIAAVAATVARRSSYSTARPQRSRRSIRATSTPAADHVPLSVPHRESADPFPAYDNSHAFSCGLRMPDTVFQSPPREYGAALRSRLGHGRAAS